VPLLAGCAAGTQTDVAEATGGELAIYSSMPLQGPDAQYGEQVVDGEKLALSQAGGRAGRFKVALVSLDDAEPNGGAWNAGATATNAKTAAQDTSTIAYIGDFSSPATAISLPLVNGAGIAQVSPSSPYIGLTSSLDAGQDEPGRFYPSGKRTFLRLQPGDPVEASAQVQLMRALGVHRVYVLADEENPFETPLAMLVASAVQQAHITLEGHEGITLSGTQASNYTEAARKIVASGAEAVFLGSEGGAGAAALWEALHEADASLHLLACSGLDDESFTQQIGAAEASTYITTPWLGASSYGAAARRVLASVQRAFRVQATPVALSGYEAMKLVLAAIRAAGPRGNDRAAVAAELLATRTRESVLGSYAIESDGETTLDRYGADVVRDGRPVFYRALPVVRKPAG